MSIKHIITLLFLAAMTISVNAAKSSGVAHTFPQSDGTQITVQLLGDEDFSWYQTTDGALLVRVDNYFFIAKTNSDGTLTSTGVLAHNSDARTADESALVAAQDASLLRVAGDNILRAKRKTIAGYPSSSYAPHTGEYHIPIIMMQYTDKAFAKSGDELKAEFEEYFNGTTKIPYSSGTRFQGYGSVAQYFGDASNGKFTPVFDIYGPYTADHEHDYYGKAQGSSREQSLLKEAVSKADDDIDFSQYDSNNDGKVDIVYILYAGTGANISNDNNDFWPACWITSGSYTTADGMKINVIGGANELATDNHETLGTLRAGIGVTCHEISHGLGLPDLYWTSGTPQNDDWDNCGPEDWDLMDGGENIYNGMWPCQYTAWEREILGWLDVTDLTEPQTVTLMPLNKEGGKACRVVNPDNKYEYYIIENYQSDEWNFYISNRYGSGLMITHVNGSSSGLSLAPNNTYGKPNVTILPADGSILASYSVKYNKITKDEFIEGAKGDPYPGSQNVTSLAAYKNYSGSEDMVNQYPITDITKNSDGSITFKFMGGATGDANGDKVVDIRDVAVAVQYMLSPEHATINLHATDLDGDGKVTPDDIEAIKDIILQK